MQAILRSPPPRRAKLPPMDAKGLLLECLRFSHTTLEMRVDGRAPASFFEADAASGLVSPAAIYAHCVFNEDYCVARAAATPALCSAPDWRERFGFEPRGDIDVAWAAGLHYHLDDFRSYAESVYTRSESLLGAMSESEALRPVQNYEVLRQDGKTSYRERQMPVVFNVMDIAVLHTFDHAGEIAVLNNLGAKSAG
jgi:hypothetical protein